MLTFVQSKTIPVFFPPHVKPTSGAEIDRNQQGSSLFHSKNEKKKKKGKVDRLLSLY